jgi:hypothetical protein
VSRLVRATESAIDPRVRFPRSAVLCLFVFAACGGSNAQPDAGTEPPPVVDAGDACPSGCDDGNPCTTDACGAAGCTHTAQNGTACDDANACTTSDVCRAGVCTGEAPVTCPAPGACGLPGVCDRTTGQCSRPLVDAGTPCDDANLATSDDACDATGACAGLPITCTPNDACKTYAPNGTATCAVTINAGASCDDADLTTSDDQCSATGVCVGVPVVCPVDTACMTYAPNGTATCSVTINSGASCDDGNLSTWNDRCGVTGQCLGQPVSCPTSDVCSTWTPNGTSTCTVTRNDGTPCDDQNACTPTGTCSAGSCVVGAPIVCVNGGSCVAGSCACPSGWTGPTCAVDVDECALNACGGGSTCTNTAGSFSCACVRNFASDAGTGANCTNTTPALELVIFYDEGVARKHPNTEAWIRSIFNRVKALYDDGLSSPSLTLSLNAIVKFSPLPAAITKRPCDTVSPSCASSPAGCYPQLNCFTPDSTLATEIDTSQLLSTFTTYTNTTRRAALTALSGGHDVAVLITDADFSSSTVGLGWVGTACTTSSAANIVSIAQRPTDDAFAVTMAHELGHNLNMTHDPSGSPYIMAPAAGSPPPNVFSPASLTAYRNWVAGLGANNCLNDVARDDWASHTCGNGVIDEGESCDPAIATDSCCSSTCQLQPGCVCGNTEVCCANGAPKAAGTVCGAARSECDLVDTCDGQSGSCHDFYKSPRTTCTNTGYCLRGGCASRTYQCTSPNNNQYPTWTGCENSPLCTLIQCTTPQGACSTSWAITAQDGTICGSTSQCSSGSCVPTASLKDYQWIEGAWSACSAQGLSTRSVTCVDEAGAPAMMSVCDPALAPITSRTCVP